MKKENILLILLGLLVILGGAFMLTRDKVEVNDGDVADDEIIEDSSNDAVVEEPPEEVAEDEVTEDETIEDENTEGETTEEGESDIQVDAPAPDFTLENLKGENVSLSDYEGKIVMLNFWGTWCGFCVKEMPDLDKINNEYDDVAVLAVDVEEDREKVKKYIEDGGYEFDVVLDTKGEIARKYLVGNFPTTYFIEEDGTLIGRIEGMLEYDRIVNIIENIKAER